ncbi:MAG: inositol monophosphatase [Crenarchaeota archaeon]|nr:inositol monophosphatase [Thermoproteota archaeon]
MDLLEITLDIARKAGELLRRKALDRDSLDIVAQTQDDVTRRIDLEVENLIIEEIRRREIESIVVCEEHGVVRTSNTYPKYIFVVDPLDGSANFVSNLPFYAVSIAAGVYRGEKTMIRDLEIGVVNYVPRNIIYYSDRNCNMFKIEGDDIMFDKVPHEKPSFVIYVEPRNREIMLSFLREFWEAFPDVKVRIFGAASIEMMQTILGKFTGFIDVRDKLRVVDISAAYVCARVCGASIIDTSGRDLGEKIILELPRSSFVLSRYSDVVERISSIFHKVLRKF